MNAYLLNTETNEYPVFEGDLKKRFNNVSFPSPLTVPPEPYVWVVSSQIPVTDELTQYVEEVAPKQVNGAWTQQWEIKTFSQEEQANILQQKTFEARQKRNELLTQSDWTQIADAPVDKTAWAAYRQLLRDITTQPGFPTDITWPAKPE